MALGGAALKLFQTILYAIEFCCAGIILGIYGYFLSVLADRSLVIPQWEKAVTGISGAAVLYTIFAVVLTCFLGGKTIFAFLAIVLDVLFAGAFVALAVLTRDGSKKCTGNVNSPIGDGPADSKLGFDSNGQGRQVTYASSLGFACRLNSACFAVAIVGAILFLFSAVIQLFIGKNHKKEKRYGPSPANGYTRGSGMKFFGRRNRRSKHAVGPHRDAEMATGTVPATTAGTHHVSPTTDYRPSHDTAYTGSTVAPAGGIYEGNQKKHLSGGYHTGPVGTHGTHGTTPATNY